MTPSTPPGLILAGGLSRRMGTDKTQAPLAGHPLLDHVAAALRPQVSALWLNAPAGHPLAAGLPIVPDTLEGNQGPLAGLLAGLRHARKHAPSANALITAPGDSPFLPSDLVARLMEAAASGDCIAMARSLGRDHPVVALWPLSLADDLEAWLTDPENRRVMGFIARHRHVSVDFATHPTKAGAIDPFFNINTPDDLKRAETLLEAGSQ